MYSHYKDHTWKCRIYIERELLSYVSKGIDKSHDCPLEVREPWRIITDEMHWLITKSSSCLWSGITGVLIKFGVSYCRDVGSIVETRRHKIVFSPRWSLLFTVGRHLCNNSYHVILLMMRRKFCFFLKVYEFLRWCHIDILNGLSISLPRCHVLCCLTVLYTHTCDFSFTYVICMCGFMNALSEMTK